MTTTTVDKDAPKPAAQVASDTVTLTIDGQKVVAKKGTLLVEAAKLIEQDIPVFCYHDKLKPVGACRMCLVEIEKMPRLQTACTTPVADGMVVRTQSELAKGGQNAVIAMLLSNHPLDCPVCDKGGECPLQDNTFEHGKGVSHFEEEKRHNDKAFELSEKIVLDRERCILCYRCVRFHEEIPGDRALAVIDRGSRGEIGVAPGERYDSPFQGNTIDICPVGALTSRQYRFRARPWDLQTHPSIAADDPTGAAVVVDVRDGRVLRVRPGDNAQVNDVWISDRTRFDAVPAERTTRLSTPLVRKHGALVPATWFEGLRAAAEAMRHHRVGVVASPELSTEALAVVASGALAPAASVNVHPRQPPQPVEGSIAAVAQSKSVVVVGLDPWTELPLLALWIHRAVASTAQGPGGAVLTVVHDENGLFRDTKHWLKAGAADVKTTLSQLVTAVESGTGPAAVVAAAADLKGKRTTLLWGNALDHDPEARALLYRLRTLLVADDAVGLVGAPVLFANGRGAQNVLGAQASVDPTGADGVLGRSDVEVVLVAGDKPSTREHPKGGGCLVDGVRAGVRAVWLSRSVPSDLAAAAVPDFVDVVLPLAHVYEQAGSFVNLEGRAQAFDAAGIAPGSVRDGARADWAVVAALANEAGAGLPLELLPLRAALADKNPAAHQVFHALPKPRGKRRAGLPVLPSVAP